MKSARIFVVDDEPEIVRFMQKALAKNGYETDSATTASGALQKISSGLFDVVITDLRMPEINGIELLEKIKASGVPSEVVVVTAHATMDTAVECLRKGAADYLIKPFEINELLATVEKAVEIRGLKSRLVSLEEVDKLKDEFIATITHELKTPLMAISGAIELLSMRSTPPPEESTRAPRSESDETLEKFLGIIERQTGKMKSLVEDILDFARMEAGRVDLKKTTTSLAAIIDDAIVEVGPAARAMNISVAPPDCDAVATCAREEIKRVVLNLLVNAVKYTQFGGHITVGISPSSDGFVGVSVSDDGIGLAAEHFDRIFEKFFRVDNSLSRKVGGFGLGLSIAKKIVEMHGGRIRADSDGPGKGATLSFSLPAR